MPQPFRTAMTAAVAATAAMLSGCAAVNPASVTVPYAAGDGVHGTLRFSPQSTLELRNMLVVADEGGGPGAVIGSLHFTGDRPVQVSFQTGDDPADPAGVTTVTIRPGVPLHLGSDGAAVTLQSVPEPPGSVIPLRAQAPGAGGLTLQVPVLAADGYYSTITPSLSPTEDLSQQVSPTAEAEGPGAGD